ncbi:SpvB/TcaC N-terminal domain-containing protein [Streptomyces arenae]|uniref:SpvB/TcaC N-terminal domain-containing protein n=1 Tax=Streptomyces arenae TaxID=29301 RepID=UPI00265AE966|nr:SpvB/TcaC N-terminal domain-containing protein [Streptomyces arenae]MCG7206199.1 sugar-binding protein [Streptomyces arenae]
MTELDQGAPAFPGAERDDTEPGPVRPRPDPLPGAELPSAGGAVRGIGEKFGTDAVTGTGSFAVPVLLTTGRDGFGPQMSLGYDSGQGNGPFGFGCSLRLPSVTRRTDKGLPRYDDAHESDVFVLSSAEDLVPTTQDRRRGRHLVRGYRPRVEASFARIERWTSVDDPADVHWRSWSADNVLTVYGADADARISDPEAPERVFSWLISQTRDDRGNVIAYEYDRGDGVSDQAQRYLRCVRYGNAVPLLNDAGERPASVSTAELRALHWHFTLVLDYGGHDEERPGPDPDRRWTPRPDPFSSRRGGFELRTERLCRRLLMFHSFPEEPGVGEDCLVAATELSYAPTPAPEEATRPVYAELTAVTHARFRRRPDVGYRRKAFPPVELAYSQVAVQHEVRVVEPRELARLPHSPGRLRWVDLHGEGIPGVLTEHPGAWYYLRNLSALTDAPHFGELEPVPRVPNRTLASGAELLDLSGDGRLDVVDLTGPQAGVYEQDEHAGWRPFRPFTGPLVNDPRAELRLVDVTGDGLVDVLSLAPDELGWHEGLGTSGFGREHRVLVDPAQWRGTRVVFNDASGALLLADMTGDGLRDLVRVGCAQVCYWPNLGYGRFGARHLLENCPRFDSDDRFSPDRVRLADIDGTGTSDLVYLHPDGPRLYFNQSGNGLSREVRLRGLPPATAVDDCDVVDLFGNGTACLVWTSPLPGNAGRSVRYVDLMGVKPHLLTRTTNNLGAETRIHYRSSTSFYLEDEAAGRPWRTRAPFPVQVVERVESIDLVARHRLTTRYAYHDQYFDPVERELRGFAVVDQWDTEDFDAPGDGDGDGDGEREWENSLPVAPVHTRSWFHTGVRLGGVSRLLAHEYDEGCGRDGLPDSVLPEGLTAQEEREACRALKGMLLRQEVYGLDGSERESVPYTVLERNFTVRLLQPMGRNRHAVFLAHPREQLTVRYERDRDDPRVTHAITLRVNEFGQALEEVAVAYGRLPADPRLTAAVDREEQARTLVTAVRYEHSEPLLDDPGHYRLPLPAQQSTIEVRDVVPPEGGWLRFQDWTGPGAPFARPHRLLRRTRTLYRPDDLGGADPLALLPLGRVGRRGIQGVGLTLAFTQQILARPLFPAEDLDAVLREGGYVPGDVPGEWWAPSGRTFLGPAGAFPGEGATDEFAYARAHFFRARRYRDPFQDGITSPDREVRYDPYDLLPVDTVDSLGNRSTIGERGPDGVREESGVDYRLMKPVLVTDSNGNRSAVALDTLGLVVATAAMGKRGEQLGDSLEGFDDTFMDAAAGDDAGQLLLGATRRICYDLEAVRRTASDSVVQPLSVRTILRERHLSDLAPGESSPLRQRFVYVDGSGREIQVKSQSDEPGGWISSGWKVYNAKANVVLFHEPYFTSTPGYEPGRREGVSTVRCYDATQRLVATVFPDGTYSKRVFGAWWSGTWDRADTVLADPRHDPDIAVATRGLSGLLPAGWRPWYEQRVDGERGDAEQQAARASAAHANTPDLEWFDALGRAVLVRRTDGRHAVENRVVLAITGEVLAVHDAMPGGDPRGRAASRADHDLLGRVVRHWALDSGTRWRLADVLDQELRAWDSRGHVSRTRYDAGRRPVALLVTGADPDRPEAEVTVERVVHGESLADAEERNLRGRIHVRYDQAGLSVCNGYDFKGSPSSSTRRVAVAYDRVLDWSLEQPSDVLEPARLNASTRLDAMNRPIVLTSPALDAPASVTRYRYGRSTQLRALQVQIEGELDSDGQPVWTDVVTAVRCNARGQRTRIERGNGLVTDFAYDPLTFRLVRVRSALGSRCVQDQHYTYDAAGNLVLVRDDAVPPVFFRNQRVTGESAYRYDALYRLVEATGREQLGLVDAGGRHRPVAHAEDGIAVGRYVERYAYDLVGNLLEIAHRGNDPHHPGWTREFEYAPGNRLLATSFADGPRETYAYDAHGNTVAMPHLARMEWDHRDQLRSTCRQVVDEDGEEGSVVVDGTYNVHDATGVRTRKATQRSSGVPVRDELFLSGLEFVRSFTGRHAGLIRTGLDVGDGVGVFARVETRNDVDDGSPRRRVRHQLTDHLRSVTLEFDDEGRLLAAEGYSPYGSTVWRATRGQTDAPARRGFLGKQRDDETGFCAVGARYYVPWLGRWLSCDPAGQRGPTSRYAYAACDPVNRLDDNGAWDISWKDVAIGAAVAVGTVAVVAVVVASAGTAAAPLLAATATSLGVSEATVVTGVVATGTAFGVAGTVNTANEVATGRTVTGRVLSDQERSRKLGALPVEAVATIFGMRGISFGGGGGGAAPSIAADVSVGANGTAALTRPSVDFGFSLPNIVANTEAIAPALMATAAPVVSAITGGGGGGGTSGGSGEPGGQSKEPNESAKPPPEPNSSSTTGTGAQPEPSPAAASEAAGAATGGNGANGSTSGGSTAGPQIAPYKQLGGHHIHQSAANSPAGQTSRTGNPNHGDALAIEQGVPGFSEADHDLASALQRNANRAMWGKEITDQPIGPVTITAAGEGTKLGSPSPFFEDVKAFFALIAAGRSPEQSLIDVLRSRAQIDASGVSTVRVPSR